MHLHVGLVPPLPILLEVDGALGAARRLVEPEVVRGGLFGRRSAAARPRLVELALDRIPTADQHLPLAGFGNVTADDARRVTEALAALAQGWPRLRLVTEGAEVVDTAVGTSVVLTIGGDLEALGTIARGIGHCVERIGIYVDRRRFQHHVELARSFSGSASADLQAAVEAVRGVGKRTWEVDSLQLLTAYADAGRTRLRGYGRIPLGESDSS